MEKLNNMEKSKNKKYYIIDTVAKENCEDNYFLFNYYMAINGCKYVHFNECTLYNTHEDAQKRCDEYNKFFKKGCPLNILVGGGITIVQPEGEEVENRYIIQEISI